MSTAAFLRYVCVIFNVNLCIKMYRAIAFCRDRKYQRKPRCVEIPAGRFSPKNCAQAKEIGSGSHSWSVFNMALSEALTDFNRAAKPHCWSNNCRYDSISS